ncbi:MAG: 2-keto-4-pentenoate hydratase [Burkholderiales bacterium]
MNKVSEVGDAIAKAAARLAQAQAARQPCAPVRELIGADDLAAAYAVQEAGTRARLAAGGRLSGRKIGLTSAAVQKQLGVSQPDYGMLFADMEVPDGGCVPATRLLQPRAEAEIAFVLGRDLDAAPHAQAALLRAIDYAVCAIEIVDSRIANWDIGIADTIADNASSGLYVLGTRPRRPHDLDLLLCGMVARRNGAIVATGAGAACLGNPLSAAAWLADTMAAAGRPLGAGDVILSGALGAMVPVSAGDVFEAQIQGLGSVRVAFGRA